MRVGLFGLVFVVFLTLKLSGVVAWSWWLVTAPLWGPLAAFLAFAAVVCLITLTIVGVAWLVNRLSAPPS